MGGAVAGDEPDFGIAGFGDVIFMAVAERPAEAESFPEVDFQAGERFAIPGGSVVVVQFGVERLVPVAG